MNKKRATLPKADVLFGNTKEDKQQNIFTAKQQNAKTVKQETVKVTLYFSLDTIKEIEKAKVKLFTDYNIRTTKSLMVETAVKNITQNLNLLSNSLAK